MARPQTAKPKAAIAGNPNPNKDLPLQGINYANLNGEAFKEYESVIASLFLDNKYDFEMWRASSVIKKRFNENTGKVDDYIDGIKLNDQQPIQYTRIKLRDALELNKQITHNTADRQNSKYFLLTKPKAE